MADEKGNDAALTSRIEKLEDVVRQNEVLRRQTRTWSLVGMLVILVLLLTFVFRIYKHVEKTYVTEIRDNPEEFVTSFVRASGIDRTLKQQAEIAIVQLRDEVLKKFSETFYDELTARMPEIEKQAVEMGGRLADHSREHLEGKVNDALAASLEACMEEIQKTFPELEEKEFETYIAKGQELFVERLHDVIEERYAMVDAHLVGLKSAVNKVRHSKGSEEMAKANQGEVAELLINALVDVIVYELKPELGNEPAE